MKIYYVDPMSYNNLSRYDKSLIENMIHEDNVISYFCSKSIDVEIDKDIISFKNYNYNNKKIFSKIFSYIFSQIKLLYSIVICKPDIVHFQWYKIPIFDFYIIKLIKLLSRCKIIYTAHNLLPHNTGKKYEKMYKKINNSIDGIVCHSQKTKDELVHLYNLNEERIKVIPHGLLDLNSIDKFQLNDIDANDYSSYFNIIFLGSLSEYKGINILKDAWLSSSVLKEAKSVKLTIAGKGDIDFKELEEISNVNIINRFLTNYEFSTLLQVADIVVLPYIVISQSGVLLSALNERTPVIVSNVGGLTEPFTIGNVGWILEDITTSSLQKCLEEIIENKDKVEAIKQDDSLWEKVFEYYSWETIAKKTLGFYLETLSK